MKIPEYLLIENTDICIDNETYKLITFLALDGLYLPVTGLWEKPIEDDFYDIDKIFKEAARIILQHNKALLH